MTGHCGTQDIGGSRCLPAPVTTFSPGPPRFLGVQTLPRSTRTAPPLTPTFNRSPTTPTPVPKLRPLGGAECEDQGSSTGPHFQTLPRTPPAVALFVQVEKAAESGEAGGPDGKRNMSFVLESGRGKPARLSGKR